MKVSREQMVENRRRILEAAGRLFRARGFEAVTVAEVMREAGLTHGGFYGHFRSKDDLIAATLAELVVAPEPEPTAMSDYAARYLSPGHRDNPGGGCPVAALVSETIRQAPVARAAMTEGLRRQIARLADGADAADSEAARQAAIGSWAAMVGAMIFARMSDDPDLSDEVLAQTRAWIARALPAGAAE
ncbi:TetR/AcrR family transcriptional regulator [Methylobacterium sp. J-072]|uniref:TetR/AcrR family transcriptional regulator n=1 Tax=Methylobacterium sp. J-072 TaxID=2836651 RepID=UPI001FBB5A28|nr:TetR/AcrR family transcriptional regulator [Methylobacterium sp. J-072]MCJ2094109.1 TetR/AcrR family transcriptional regulator [Methylobacterium sp. J-072]